MERLLGNALGYGDAESYTHLKMLAGNSSAHGFRT